jgi:hypothetical protein
VRYDDRSLELMEMKPPPSPPETRRVFIYNLAIICVQENVAILTSRGYGK